MPPTPNSHEHEHAAPFPERVVSSAIAIARIGEDDNEHEIPCDLVFSTDNPLVVQFQFAKSTEFEMTWAYSLASLEQASVGSQDQVIPGADFNLWSDIFPDRSIRVVGEISVTRPGEKTEYMLFSLPFNPVDDFLLSVAASKSRAPFGEEHIIAMKTDEALEDIFNTHY